MIRDFILINSLLNYIMYKAHGDIPIYHVKCHNPQVQFSRNFTMFLYPPLTNVKESHAYLKDKIAIMA